MSVQAIGNYWNDPYFLEALQSYNPSFKANTKNTANVTNTNTNQGGDQPGGTPSEGGAPPDGMKKTDKDSNETKAVIKNVKITTYQDKSRGLDATFGGIIEAENVEINTNGNSCAAIATDRGEGNITVKN